MLLPLSVTKRMFDRLGGTRSGMLLTYMRQ